MPPTLTPRLGLKKPDPADLYDVAIVNENSDKLDADVGGLVICTSATRPSTPISGQIIFETDTRRYYHWSGSVWTLFPFGITVCTSGTRPATPFQDQAIYETDTGAILVRNSGAWVTVVPGTIFQPGLVAGNSYDASNSTLTTMANNTTEQLSGMSIPSATYKVGYLYRVTAMIEKDDVAGGRLLFKLRMNGVAGTQIGAAQSPGQVSASIREHILVTGLIRPSGSDVTDTIVLTATRGATNATVPHFFRNTVTRPFIQSELLGLASKMPSV
ncbi:MAG: hypothetical protein AB7L09_22265 [Nitrospira sp.]